MTSASSDSLSRHVSLFVRHEHRHVKNIRPLPRTTEDGASVTHEQSAPAGVIKRPVSRMAMMTTTMMMVISSGSSSTSSSSRDGNSSHYHQPGRRDECRAVSGHDKFAIVARAPRLLSAVRERARSQSPVPALRAPPGTRELAVPCVTISHCDIPFCIDKLRKDAIARLRNSLASSALLPGNRIIVVDLSRPP